MNILRFFAVIRPGTQAAIGLSKEDLVKRTKVHEVKHCLVPCEVLIKCKLMEV